ncbi:MAG: hypothetical protein IPH20_06370 [Bacteroidales bacterium]|nr:hypothetical protein [Bacteroidales bacterium]
MKTRNRALFWIPRILCILAILFIAMFALDAFEQGLSIWQQLAGFAIHLIPSLILLVVLIFAWKRELAGGVIFTLIGLVFSPIVFYHNYNLNHSIWMSLGIILMVTFPFILTGILFIINHFKRNKEAHQG